MNISIKKDRSTSNTSKLEALEGLRGACALLVLINHLIYGMPGLVGDRGFFLTAIASFAHLSVLVFFVLSGFVIRHSTPDNFSNQKIRIYLLKRLIRLYPIYLFALILSFIASNSGDFRVLVGHLFFTQGWLVPLLKTNGPLWSLHYEFLFYLLFIPIWRFRLSLPLAILFCSACSILTLVSNFHLFRVLGYFTLWLIGCWIADNYKDLFEQNQLLSSTRFWGSIVMTAAFSWSNAFEIFIRVYGVKYEGLMPPLPSVVSDIIISGLIGSILAATLGFTVPGFKICFGLAITSVVIAISYALKSGIFLKMLNYQMAAIFLLVIPITFSIRGVSTKVLKNISIFGSFSYALYVIHSPIAVLVYRYAGVKEGSAYWSFNFWVGNFIVLLLALGLAYLLEHFVQPRVASRLKTFASIA